VSRAVELRTKRLWLRQWRDADRAAFHALNCDPAVMATIGPVMSRSESDAFMNRISQRFSEQPFGLWCVDLDGEPIGFTGLSVPWFRDGVEVGWRLRSQYWGHGYAPEAARECLRYAFEELALDEVISFTAESNANSQRVMQKIGLVRDYAADFDHPGVPDGSPLRPHVLYRMNLARYRALL
jgi:ribosomal-protein-alanine N-acetyltransferase